jgi:DNA-binding transcriptional MerR regulator
MSKLINISQLSIILNLINPKNKKPLNHTVRFWEKEFKQIKPKKINNRRYYTEEQVETFKLIKFLLKNKGMTISGVKLVLNSNINKLDDYNSHGLKAEYYKEKIKDKSKTLIEKINKLKNYGKKNTLKSKNGSRKQSR